VLKEISRKPYEIVTGLFDLMKESTFTLPKRGVYLQNLLEHVKVIICNLHAAAHTDPAIYIEFRRDGAAYKAVPGYAGFQFSSGNVRRVTGFLHDAGYVELNTGYPGSIQYRRQLSKMRATPRLLDLLSGADPGTIYQDITHVETVIMKGVKKGKTGVRDVVRTPNTPAVRQMRSNLATINNVLRHADIDIDIDQGELAELNRKLSGDPDKYKHPIDMTSKYLYRVFVDRSLKRHGRFYGGWWIGIPEEYRERMVINGMPVTELDFSGLHPHILYGLEDAQLPTTDPYKLPGYPNTLAMRKLLKRFLLIIVNAASPAAAKGALRKAYVKDTIKASQQGREAPPSPVALTDATLDPIILILRKRHNPIQHHFFTGMGNELMYHDSQMAEEVMLQFAGIGIPCLPVHDSFIVGVQHAQKCWDAMQQAFNFRFDQKIPIDYQNILAIHGKTKRAVPLSSEWDEMESKLTWEIKKDW
jgi:hypothetical protein